MTTARFRSHSSKTLGSLGRATAASALIFVCIAALVQSGVSRANAEEATVALDSLFRNLVEMSDSGDSRQILVNGEPFGIHVRTTQESPGQVFDRIESWCSEANGDDPSGVVSKSLHKTELAFPLMWHAEGAEKESLGCFKSEANGALDFLGRLQNAMDQHNLDLLGRFYFFLVQDVGTRVRVVEISTGEGFDLGTFLHDSGDVPGMDLPGLPRPYGSRRLFSLGELGEKGALAIYGESPRGLHDVVRDYRGAFNKGGYSTRLDERTGQDEHTFIVEHKNYLATLVVWQEAGLSFAAVSAVSEAP